MIHVESVVAHQPYRMNPETGHLERAKRALKPRFGRGGRRHRARRRARAVAEGR